MGHVLSQILHGLILGVAVSEARGRARYAVRLNLLDDLHERQRVRPTTLGADGEKGTCHLSAPANAWPIEPVRSFTT